MKEQLISPRQAWAQLSEFWKPFSFMLVDGAEPMQIEDFENREQVELKPRTKQLISIYSGVGIPTGFYGYFCAETTLYTIDKWVRFDNSILNTQMDDPSFWPQIFKESNLPSDSMKDYVVIGSDPWGADYGYYVMIHQESETAYSINWNIPEVSLLGDVVTWLANHRLGNFANVKAYVDNWNNESDEPGGASIAKQNSFYLGLGYPEELARWNVNEDKFITVFDRIGQS